ncbi:LysE family translocator [Aestuariibacter sp. AA17]|uniref:LysE family translocator n=1 Tax=Fluctibacter corallii TaxID=2984329 RepID=A0ABT3A766_9ALTE|nr:LysE family translocator [Aestuariibacter sp. AA17]MCV2884538.1 LysE family translocator [Aestuariibacter sp. AA17]
MIELLPALALFAFVSSATPGPNNLMLMASGANFGFKPTLPHMIGVAFGFTVMVILVGMGIMALFELYPITYDLLRIFSVGYLLYLAFKIAAANKQFDEDNTRAKPFTFWQAVLFQWVNPKAWSMALTALSVYAPSREIEAVFFVAIIFGLINFPTISVWVVTGQKIKLYLKEPKRLSWFNRIMALLLVGSLYPMFM